MNVYLHNILCEFLTMELKIVFLTGREEYPTLLHFAARFGLEKLCWQLLECPGGEAACQIRNGNQLGPAELAEKAGHTSLAQALNSYLVGIHIYWFNCY